MRPDRRQGREFFRQHGQGFDRHRRGDATGRYGSRQSKRVYKGAETYAIEIAGTGTVTLEEVVYTGYAKPINVLATSGTVTIELAPSDEQPAFDTRARRSCSRKRHKRSR
jgi:hypothetical protein